MKRIGLKTLLMAVILAFVLVACNETTTPTVNKPDAPTGLKATSISSTSIKLKWTLSTSETDAKFTGYILEIAPGTFLPVNISKGTTTYTVTGLTEGTIYTFTLKSVMDSEESATGATVTWSPATRFTINVNDAPIRVYEYASALGSGLDLYDPVGRAPKTLTVANGGDWNLALDTRNSGEVIVASPNMVNYNYGTQPDVTQISSNYWENAASLDDVFDSEALSTGTFSEQAIDIEALSASTSTIVLVLRTKEGTNTEYTYAKVFISKTGGSWLQGTAPNRYLECVVSYQQTPGVPYAF